MLGDHCPQWSGGFNVFGRVYFMSSERTFNTIENFAILSSGGERVPPLSIVYQSVSGIFFKAIVGI